MNYHWDFTFLLGYARLFAWGVAVTLAFTLGTILVGMCWGFSSAWRA